MHRSNVRTAYPPENGQLGFQFNDGGRAAAGYKGDAPGDCVCRSIAIVAQKDYQEVYDLIIWTARKERPGASKDLPKTLPRSHPRLGVYRYTQDAVLKQLGFVWTPTMGIGTGCRVHLMQSELPAGRLAVRVSKHLTAVIDGVLHDLCDSHLRAGNRCVYGYYQRKVD